VNEDEPDDQSNYCLLGGGFGDRLAAWETERKERTQSQPTVREKARGRRKCRPQKRKERSTSRKIEGRNPAPRRPSAVRRQYTTRVKINGANQVPHTWAVKKVGRKKRSRVSVASFSLLIVDVAAGTLTSSTGMDTWREGTGWGRVYATL